jgi:sugar lactone lactonase YvrE
MGHITTSASLSALLLIALARQSAAVDVVLGGASGDKIGVQINEKSASPASHSIKFSAKSTAILLGPSNVDDPVANGAAAVVFSATDCQCIVLGQAPGTAPGWTVSPATGTPKTYKWKDLVTKSAASVKGGTIKLKTKGGVTYGLDAASQGPVEVQLRMGTAPATFCARFAEPIKPTDDGATIYKSKVFASGTTSCSAVPGFCGPCEPPVPTSTTTSTTTTSTTTTTIACNGFVTAWGGSGSGNGQLFIPYDVAVDSAGSVFVADTYNHRIQKFDSNGGFLTTWGSQGYANDQFVYPSGIDTDASGNVWVADTNRGRIAEFDGNGNYLASFGVGQLSFASDVVVAPNGNFYVGDGGNARIVKFDPAGNVLTMWGSFGTGDGQFSLPWTLALDASGNVFVGDGDALRVQKFDADGGFLTKWDGSAIGPFESLGPTGIAIDGAGRVVVTDGSNNRMTLFSGTGTFLGAWGSFGTTNGKFVNPRGVAVDALGNIYVVDTWDGTNSHQSVQKFTCQ